MPTIISNIANQILKNPRLGVKFPIGTPSVANAVASQLEKLLPSGTKPTVIKFDECGFKAAIVLESVESPNHMVFARPPKS